MKRYWKSVVLIALIVISLGSFYIESLLNPLPSFKLVKSEGDEKQAADIVMQGRFEYANGDVRVDQAGSSYDSEKSLLWQLAESHRYYDYKTKIQLNRLQQEHGSFMRGKENLIGFYEDKQVLVYVDLESTYNQLNRNNKFDFQVSVLDKSSSKVSDFEISVPNDTNYLWMNIQNVQMVDKQLKLLTRNAKRTAVQPKSGNLSETHIYSIDPAAKKILQDDMAGEDQYVDETTFEEFFLLHDVQALTSSERVIYQHKTTHLQKLNGKSNVDSSYSVSSVDYSFSSYNLRTGKEEMIPFPINSSTPQDTDSYYVSGERILKLSADKAGMTIEKYNLSDRKSEPAITLAYSDLGSASLPRTSFDDRNMYLLVHTDKRSEVIIIDLANGQTVYKGAAVVEGSAAEQEAQLNKLNLQNIVLMK
ncbi:hypothetical protein ACFPYJ_21640 [Paenibacillus solisilvae]|uniref:Uncharacterized protein n=1 Tax=Paenibacillus solisilvae TaxID=2486751 RepID=A0ABW0W3N7_9BACL